MEVEKIDLSLDDIIKLNRKEKKLSARGGRGQGQQRRGRGSQQGGFGRGSKTGGGSTQRGVGRGSQRGGRGLGRGSQRGGRGLVRGSQRGGGRIQRGLGRGSQRGGSTQRGLGRGSQRGGTQQGFKGRGLNKVKQFRTNLNTKRGGRGSKGVSPMNRNALFTKKNSYQKPQGAERSLQVQKSQALKALQQAKKTLSQLNAQTRSSTNRQNLVNQRRGLQNKYNNVQAQPQQRQQLKRNFGNNNGARRGKSRQWRAQQNTTKDSDGMLTVHVNNSMPQSRQKKQKKINRTGFQPQSTTGMSLSDRFGGGSGGNGNTAAGRRVFY